MQHFYRTLAFEIGLTIVLVGALAGGLSYFGGIINGSVARIQELRQELTVRWSSLYQLADLLTDYNLRAAGALETLQRTVPTRDSIFNLGRDLKTVAAASGVEQSYAFASEIPVSSGTLGYVEFSLSATGSYEQLLAHLRSLASFSYLSKFDSVSLTKTDGRSSMSVAGRVFFQ